MRILFLDDDKQRHARFRARNIGLLVVYVHSYDEAVAALAGERFDQVWLDHDLSEMAAVGMPSPGEKTGYDVACFIEEMPPERRPVCAYVHSMNPAGGDRIVATMKAAGIPTKRTWV